MLSFQRDDPALEHPVHHHNFGAPVVEAEHDAATVMRQAYPFLRDHRARGRVQQTQISLTVATPIRLQFQRGQRQCQIRAGLLTKSLARMRKRKHGNLGAQLGTFSRQALAAERSSPGGPSLTASRSAMPLGA